MADTLFGTDGIRGVAGEYPLDAATVQATGVALGEWAAAHQPGPEVIIGMDTRESGPGLAAQMGAGLQSVGVRVHFAGLIPTPGVAYLTKNGPFVAGVMISASHNPYCDNGIKIFGHSGYKLPDVDERHLEEAIARLKGAPATQGLRAPSTEAIWDQQYADYLAASVAHGIGQPQLVVDCGNGAAAEVGPALLERLGARLVRIGCEPDGRNINLNCGALHVDGLAKRVVAEGADAGFAFDGDADRCIAVSASGRIVDGDMVLLAAGRYLKSLGRLPGSVVVATVMSNLGLERALDAEGIRLVRTSVGDKNVLEEMVRRGAVLGGEQSGHTIFSDWATTGDGLLTALRLLDIMRATGRSLDELTADFVSYPQILINVYVREKVPLREIPSVNEAIAAAETGMGANGRVLVRYSGTELMARVMVEAPTQTEVNRHATRIADAIRAEIGVVHA
jgi:phosphoglucosamine mutase